MPDSRDCSYTPTKAVDVAAAPNGDLLIAVKGEMFPQAGGDDIPFLIRLSRSTGNDALAQALPSQLPGFLSRLGISGVTVDSRGNTCVAFPLTNGPLTLPQTSRLFRFAQSFPNPAVALPSQVAAVYDFGPVQTEGMGHDPQDRLYITTWAPRPNALAAVAVFDNTAQGNARLGTLGARLLDQPHDVAVGERGKVYVTSTEVRFGRPVARVTRTCLSIRMLSYTISYMMV